MISLKLSWYSLRVIHTGVLRSRNTMNSAFGLALMMSSSCRSTAERSYSRNCFQTMGYWQYGLPLAEMVFAMNTVRSGIPISAKRAVSSSSGRKER